jgi:DNA relaxase NicK
MQDIIAYSSLKRLSFYYVKVNLFKVNMPKPTRILCSSSVECSTVEADVTYINKYSKKFSNILSFKKISRADHCVSYLRHLLLHFLN